MKVELRDLTPAERRDVQQRFEGLAATRFAPTPKKPRQEVWWPRAPLDGRAFPEGIHPADGDSPFNESARLIGFLNGVCGGEFYIANLTAPKPHFRHTGRLDEGLTKWIKTRLVSNPTCLLASNVDVFIIVDSKMRYSVLGAPPEIIEKFEKRFGGAETLQRNFSNYIGEMRIGTGVELKGWSACVVQNKKFARVDLYVTGGNFRIASVLVASDDFTSHSNDVFATQLLCFRMCRRGVRRIENHLSDTVAIAQIDKREITKVSAFGYPTHQYNLFSNV